MSGSSSPSSNTMSSPHTTIGTRKPRGHKGLLSTSTMLLLIFTNGASFMAGTFYASNAAIASQFPNQQKLAIQPLESSSCPPVKCPPIPQLSCPPCPEQPQLSCPPCREEPADANEEEEESAPAEENEEDEEDEDEPEETEEAEETPLEQRRAESSSNNKQQQPKSLVFPEIVNRFAVGAAFTTKENFTATFDLGMPVEYSQKEGEKGVMIIYSSPQALPRKFGNTKAGNSNDPMRILSAQEATENCDYMNVIMTYHEGKRRQCLAIVPQYESFHIQKWLRVPEKGPSMGSFHPLRMVPRGKSMNGENAFHPPAHEKHTKKAWKMLEGYLDSVDDVIAELKPIVQKIASNNAIVVMVCNFGQSQLLLNFACSARAKGLDVSNVLVFATDQETQDLAVSIGLTSFFDKRNFGSMPKKAAKTYGDGIFTNMMLSKVICVHLASLVGVDFLFQDVDVMWYRNPLQFFQNNTSPIRHFDAYFQDDGSRSLRFAPFCANSGFYFIRNNPRTRYFLTSFLMQSDLVLRSFSHQSAMIAILSEHSSLLGLRVKVLPPEEFPSGFIYHRKKGRGHYGNYFTDLFKGKQKPWVLHMSWTKNKNNKVLYYKQLDQWYLQDKCMDKKVSEIALPSGSGFVDNCCSAESLFSCHYRDKPSSRPCKDSPALDKNGQSFW